MNCSDCWHESTCENKNRPDLVFCFKKQRSLCATCADSEICLSKSNGMLICCDWRKRNDNTD